MPAESAIVGWLAAVPLIGALAVLMIPAAQVRRAWIGVGGARAVACLAGVATFVLACVADARVRALGDALRTPALGAWSLAADLLAMPLVLLAAGLTLLACWASWGIRHQVKRYYATLLIAQTLVQGALLARESWTLACCLLGTVIALFTLLSGWGAERRRAAALRFLCFMLPAVVLLAIGALARFGNGPFDAAHATAEFGPALWAILLACAVLAAVVPLHGWLAGALAEGATPIGLWTAGIVPTLGCYGMLRLVQPDLAAHAAAAWPIGIAGGVTALYGALAALREARLKRLAAFACVSLGGFFLMGLAAQNHAGVAGASHLITGRAAGLVMFLFVAGLLEERLGHDVIGRLGGLGGILPGLAGWSALAIPGAMGLPGLCVFAGPLLVVLGTFQRSAAGAGGASPAGAAGAGGLWLGVAGVAAMLLLLICGLWTYERTFLGASRPGHSTVARLSASEHAILAILGLASLALGLLG